MVLLDTCIWYFYEYFHPLVRICLIVPALLILSTSYARERANDIISFAIHSFLCILYPINSVDGKVSLPTCPYRWPSGQGDVGKFLEGLENSALWGKQHGKIYRIWSGMTSEIVLTRPEDIQTVFKDSDKHIKAVNNNAGWLMGEILGQCVGLISGKNWRTLRSVTGVAFLRKDVTSHIPLVEVRTKQHFDSLHASGRLDQGLINPVDDLKMLPFLILANIIYGDLSPEMEGELLALIPLREGLFRRMITGKLSRFSLSKYLPIQINRDLSRFKKTWSAFNMAAYKRSLADDSSAPIVQMYSHVQSVAISHNQLCQTLDEILFANLDVTIGGISWNLLFLGAHQDSQTDLRTEIATKRRDTLIESGQWQKYLLDSSNLLSASMYESARLKPLAAFSVPQATPTDRIVGGFVVPAGTDFVIDSHSLNIRNPYWGDDNTTYRPRRFLERKIVESRYHYWRFGFGPRTCMGKYLADLVIKVVLVHLVENYRLSLVKHGKDWNRNAETWILHPDTDICCQRILRKTPETS